MNINKSVLSLLGMCVVSTNLFAEHPPIRTTSGAFAPGGQTVQTSTPVVFDYGGQTYIIDNQEAFEELLEISESICLASVSEGRLDTLAELLLNTCRENVVALAEAINANEPLFEARAGVHNAMNEYYPGPYTEQLRVCQLSRQRLQERLSRMEQKNVQIATFTYDADACINSIIIDENADMSGNSCPMVPTLTTPDSLATVKNQLNNLYWGRSYSFNLDVDSHLNMNPQKYLVFTGTSLIACNGSRAELVASRAFSGNENCRGGAFEMLPARGNLPGGVYMMRSSAIEKMEKNLDLWGSHRVPLIPANETDVHDRSSFYIHGNQDDHASSGGCITLGTSVEKFLTDPWFDGAGDMMVIVKNE